MSTDLVAGGLQDILRVLQCLAIMSISGGLLTALLLLLKPALRGRVPQSVRYRLWKIVLAAYLVPVSLFIALPFRTPAVPVGRVAEEVMIADRRAYQKEAQMVYHTSYESLDTGERYNLLDYVHLTRAPQAFLVHLPLAVTAVLAGRNLIKYLIFRRRLHRSRRPARKEDLDLLQTLYPEGCELELRRSALAPTAMLAGVLFPVIYLPDRDYPDGQLEHILRHELAHLKRRDVLVKWLAVWAAHLHWFNPMAHWACRELSLACELACDEAAVKGLDDSQKQAYGETLIDIAAGERLPPSALSTTMCEEKRTLKERLTAIMRGKPATLGATVLSCAVVALAACLTVALGASATPVIDRPSVTTVRVSSWDDEKHQLRPPEDSDPIPPEEGDELVRLINAYNKNIYPRGDHSSTGLDNWVRLDCADGGYYLLHYWYWNGFSWNPLHGGEDDYTSLLTYYDSDGVAGTTWQMEYDFDWAYLFWRAPSSAQYYPFVKIKPH